MPRRAHFLKANKSVQKPSHLIFVDTETKGERIDADSETARLWFGWACRVRRLKNDAWSQPDWIRFTTAKQFWSWVDARVHDKRKLYVFAHNMGFDFNVLQGFTTLTNQGWTLSRAIVEDPPTVLTWRKAKTTIACVDTLNYFRVPLATLGEEFGYPKLDMPPHDAGQDVWDHYCRTDCDILRVTVLDLIDLITEDDLGNFQVTLASQSFTAFRHRFMNDDILIDMNEKALRLAREGYMGGRTEAFYLGEVDEPVYVLDINSQYPAIMAQEFMPTVLRSVWQRVDHQELIDTIKDNCVIAEVAVDTDVPIVPVRFEGRLVFPTGRFTTVLPTPEIRLLLGSGVAFKVVQMGVYRQARIFSDYVDYFYKARLRARELGTNSKAYMYKIFMNSLYGKFGQNGVKFHESGHSDTFEAKQWLHVDAETGEVSRMRQIGTLVQRQSRAGESLYSHPAIAAHVASGGRALLWTYAVRAGLTNVFYTDTDSLTVNRTGYENLLDWIDPSRLGFLKLEHAAERLEIRGAKDYTLGSTTKIKGIRKDAEQVGEHTFRQTQFRGLKGMLNDGELDRVVIRKITKTLTRKYTKGIAPVRGRIVPFTFDAGKRIEGA